MKNLNLKVQQTAAERIATLKAELAAAEKEARDEADVAAQERAARREQLVEEIKGSLKGLVKEMAGCGVGRLEIKVVGKGLDVVLRGIGKPRSVVVIPEEGVRRTYKDKEYVLRSTEAGLVVEGIEGTFRSLTAAAKAISGTGTNGKSWWRIA